jgi:hypothetical protein
MNSPVACTHMARQGGRSRRVYQVEPNPADAAAVTKGPEMPK